MLKTSGRRHLDPACELNDAGFNTAPKECGKNWLTLIQSAISVGETKDAASRIEDVFYLAILSMNRK